MAREQRPGEGIGVTSLRAAGAWCDVDATRQVGGCVKKDNSRE